MTGLKPCPFCGATPADDHAITNGNAPSVYLAERMADGWFVGCRPCGFKCTVTRTEAEAVAAWNRRPMVEVQPQTIRFEAGP